MAELYPTGIDVSKAGESSSMQPSWKSVLARVSYLFINARAGLGAAFSGSSQQRPATVQKPAPITRLEDLDTFVDANCTTRNSADFIVRELRDAIMRALNGGITKEQMAAYFNRMRANDLLMQAILQDLQVTSCVAYMTDQCHQASIIMDVYALVQTYPPAIVDLAIERLRTEGQYELARHIKYELAQIATNTPV